jgi:uncharacterized protein DUF4189
LQENRSMRQKNPIAALILAVACVVVSATPALAAFGAIAWDRGTGRQGWSWDQTTPQKAAELAISACGASDCKVIIHTGTGQCAALAATANGKFIGASARKTEPAARVAALTNCQKGKAGDCVVKVSHCNK